MKMKRILPLFIAIAMLFLALPVSAYTFPRAYWKLQTPYNNALDSGDYENIIYYGKQIIDLFEGDTADEATDNLATCNYEVANAYEALGDYESAAYYYEQARPFYVMKGWDDGVTIIDSKVSLYKSSADLELYRSYYSYQSYFGEINEKQSGVLFGANADSPVLNNLGSGSVVLIYHNLGDDSIFDLNANLVKEAAASGKAVEYALNLPGEGNDLASIESKTAQIKKVIDMLAKSGTPVYLRFAAEFDTWSVQGDPESYIKAYRYVADLVHNSSTNIAMVWSVTMRPAFGLDPNAYYPGDEYVDWIGMSLYMVKYFGGQDYEEGFYGLLNQTQFAAGIAANPVTILKDYIERYGDRKPFMITESGATHYSRTLGRDETAYAAEHLKMLYRYVPMVYPQVKAILHFDVVRPNETDDFALSTNPTLAEVYRILTTEDSFIRNRFSAESNCSYLKLADSFIVEQGYNEFSTYAFFLGKENVTVYYYIDGTLVGSSSELPYRLPIDLSGYSVGAHTFTVDAFADGKLLKTKTYTMNILKSADVSINGEMLDLSGRKPIIENGTTLIPLRAVFEKLGGKVDWIADTRSIVITRGSLKLELAIGSYTMKKNGEDIQLAVPARLINSTTYIPLRAVVQALGGEIGWDGANKLITITAD